MTGKVGKFIKPLVVLAFAIFAVCYWVKEPSGFDDYLSYVGYAISVITLLFIVYDLWLWRFNPFEDTPVLYKKYKGTLKYIYADENCTKEIDITIKQTLLTIRVQTKTDINFSSTIAGNIAKEHGIFVLYYNYITDPDANVQEKNPPQHGTCRMVLDNTKRIKGKYWTSRRTIGDILWEEVK